MICLEFGLRLCGPLVKCLAEIGAESLSAVTSFVDAEALEELAETAEAVRVVVGDYAVPREVYEKWRDGPHISRPRGQPLHRRQVPGDGRRSPHSRRAPQPRRELRRVDAPSPAEGSRGVLPRALEESPAAG